MKYTGAAPANRIGLLRLRGATLAWDLVGLNTLALELPASVVDSLADLGWVESYEIDSTMSYLASDTYGWNIVHPGGQAVHAYERGAGVKIAYLDGGAW